MLCQPRDLTCYDEAAILKCLFSSGADIYQINAIRKHISLARGGHLARYAYPAKAVSFIFSDVPGDNLEFVASGPTILDTTTSRQAQEILDKYNVNAVCKLPNFNFVETPKQDTYFANVKNILASSNKFALDAMAAKAKELGFSPQIVSSNLNGAADKVAAEIVAKLDSSPKKTALFYGGELTVDLGQKRGTGGRNQELVLLALGGIKSDSVILAAASDGRDNTDFAGAIGDYLTAEKSAKMNLDKDQYLKEHDSFNFFMQTGDYLMTVVTGSNVSDLIIALKD